MIIKLRKFGESVRLLQSVEGQLTNLRKRAPEAAKDAVARHKAIPAHLVAKWPHWKNAAAGVLKMAKPVASAEKAVEAIIKLHDKKKLAAMKVDDLKKKVQGFMSALKAVSDEGTVFWSTRTTITKEAGGFD